MDAMGDVVGSGAAAVLPPELELARSGGDIRLALAGWGF